MAFAAQADDPSAIHFNPAGMTQLEGIQLYLGTNLVSGDIQFQSSVTGETTSGDFDGTIAVPPPSNFYITANVADIGVDPVTGLTLGIGLTTPYGLLVNYPNDSQVSQVTSFAAFQPVDIKPTVAIQLGELFSIGGGFDIYTFTSAVSEGQAEQKIIAGPEWGVLPLAALGIAPGSEIEANGKDTEVGFNIGFMLTPWRNADEKPRLNLALVYRSQVSLDLEGKLLVNGAEFADAKTEFNLPEIISGALALWPIRDKKHEWKTEVDLEYVKWSSFQNLDLTLTNITTLPSAEVTLPFPRNYNDVTVILFGNQFTWLRPDVLPKWDVATRIGYSWSPTPVPESTFVPAVPDSDAHALSLGLGFNCHDSGKFLALIPCDGLGAKGIGIDLAYQLILYENRTIENNLDPLQRVDGLWKNTVNLGALNLRLFF